MKVLQDLKALAEEHIPIFSDIFGDFDLGDIFESFFGAGAGSGFGTRTRSSRTRREEIFSMICQ